MLLTVSENDELIETIESRTPVHEGDVWTGHVVVHLPGAGVVFDATVGQGQFANTQQRQFPALLKRPELAGPIPAGSEVGLRRFDGHELMYEFLPDTTVDYRNPGGSTPTS